MWKSQMLASGSWLNLVQRPFGIIADPAVTPKAIHISAFDTAPLAPDYSILFRGGPILPGRYRCVEAACPEPCVNQRLPQLKSSGILSGEGAEVNSFRVRTWQVCGCRFTTLTRSTKVILSGQSIHSVLFRLAGCFSPASMMPAKLLRWLDLSEDTTIL